MWNNSNFPEVACSLVSIILIENNIELSNEKFEKIFQTTNLKIDQYWYSWFFNNTIKKSIDKSEIAPEIPEKNLNKNVNDENDQKTIEEKEESDDDMGFGLFD